MPPPLRKRGCLVGFGYQPPEFDPNMTLKVRAVSPSHQGVERSRFLLLRGHGPLLERTTQMKKDPRGMNIWVVASAGNFGHFGVLVPLGDPLAPRRQGIWGSQNIPSLWEDST